MDRLISEGYRKSTNSCADAESFDYWKYIICDEFVQLDCEKTADGAFQGELRGGVGVGKLRFAEVVSDPQHVIRSRRQIARCSEEEFLISFQLSQRGLVRQSGREALLTPGSFALYDSTQPYSLTFDQRFHQLVVQMPRSVLSQHLMNPEQYTAIPISGRSGLGAVLGTFVFSLVRELHTLEQAPQELADNLLNMIAMAYSSSVMLEQVNDSSVGREALKRRVRQYIERNLCNAELSNQHIADAQGISVRYLHKLFQQERESIHALIVSRRLARARELLEDPRYRGHCIETIAYRVGFASAAHFSRSFKARYGLSPSDLRAAGVAEGS